MKTTAFLTAAIALLLPAASALATGESFRLETSIYIFRNSDAPLLRTSQPGHGGGFRAPATMQFGNDTLSLLGERFAWSGGKNPPDRFNLVGTPAVMLAPGRPVTLLSAVPVQYLEKAADESLHVREIPADSPDAPHWRLRFTLADAPDAGDGLRVACAVDVAAVGARENLPGVTLPVGKPVLKRARRSLDLVVPPKEWVAFVVRVPDDGDYSLLLLCKAVPATQAEAAAKPAEAFTTVQDFAEFMTYYYRHPQPDRIAAAIAAIAGNEFLDARKRYSYQYHQRAWISVGFFTTVFAANPQRVPEWEKIIEQRATDGTIRFWLRQALKMSRPGAQVSFRSNDGMAANVADLYWGMFLASGRQGDLQKLAEQVKLVDEDQPMFSSGATAMMLLSFHAPHHPLIRQTLMAMRGGADVRTRELIDELLNKDAEAVRQLVRSLDHGSVRSPYSDQYTTNPFGIPLPPQHTDPFGHATP